MLRRCCKYYCNYYYYYYYDIITSILGSLTLRSCLYSLCYVEYVYQH